MRNIPIKSNQNQNQLNNIFIYKFYYKKWVYFILIKYHDLKIKISIFSHIHFVFKKMILNVDYISNVILNQIRH